MILHEDLSKVIQKRSSIEEYKVILELRVLVRCISATAMAEKIGTCVVHPDRMEFTMVLIGVSKL